MFLDFGLWEVRWLSIAPRSGFPDVGLGRILLYKSTLISNPSYPQPISGEKSESE